MTSVDTGRTVTLNLPKLPTLQANVNLHWAVRAKRVKIIRSHVGWLARSMNQAPMERVRITAIVHPKTAGRYDPPNWAPLVKAAIDGIVDAGLLPDDDSTRVVSTAYEAGERTAGGPRVDLVLTEVAR